MNKNSSMVMSEGSIVKCMLHFAFPIFLGNLFQQLYSVADSLIVGNYLGSNALAAVSSSGNLIFLMVGFFQGVAMGGGIIIARYFGAKDNENVERAVHSTVAFGLMASLLLTVLGVTLAPIILELMGTPENVLPESLAYFQIYFAGSFGFVMYNVLVGILQAVGNSRSPLRFLIIASFLNLGLDILFIGVLNYGVGAAALATIISQFVSASLCIIKLTTTKEVYRVCIKKIRVDMEMLSMIIRIGLPAGLQNSIISIANVVVQSNINAFGELAMAGCGAYSKIEGFAFLPITSFTMALTTFVSQNIGAKQFDRVKKGARFGIICCMVLAEIVGIIMFIFAPQLIAAFDSNPDVIAFGVDRARASAFFFCLLAYSHCISSILRGAGKSKIPMLVMLVCWCLVRVVLLSVGMNIVKTIELVNWVYPLTWSLSTITFYVYYKKVKWLDID